MEDVKREDGNEIKLPFTARSFTSPAAITSTRGCALCGHTSSTAPASPAHKAMRPARCLFATDRTVRFAR